MYVCVCEIVYYLMQIFININVILELVMVLFNHYLGKNLQVTFPCFSYDTRNNTRWASLCVSWQHARNTKSERRVVSLDRSLIETELSSRNWLNIHSNNQVTRERFHEWNI